MSAQSLPISHQNSNLPLNKSHRTMIASHANRSRTKLPARKKTRIIFPVNIAAKEEQKKRQRKARLARPRKRETRAESLNLRAHVIGTRVRSIHACGVKTTGSSFECISDVYLPSRETETRRIEEYRHEIHRGRGL